MVAIAAEKRDRAGRFIRKRQLPLIIPGLNRHGQNQRTPCRASAPNIL